eukprot:3333234-Rhodomonas_salina.2
MTLSARAVQCIAFLGPEVAHTHRDTQPSEGDDSDPRTGPHLSEWLKKKPAAHVQSERASLPVGEAGEAGGQDTHEPLPASVMRRRGVRCGNVTCKSSCQSSSDSEGHDFRVEGSESAACKCDAASELQTQDA